MFFWNSLAFLMIQQMLAIWSLVPLPFLNPAWTSGSSQFTYCLKPGLENFEHYFASVWDECNLWRSLSILWHCFSLGLKWKLTFYSPVATAEFSKFAVESSPFTASSFRIWNSSTGILSPPLALFHKGSEKYKKVRKEGIHSFFCVSPFDQGHIISSSLALRLQFTSLTSLVFRSLDSGWLYVFLGLQLMEGSLSNI